ncbi:hypothetical protein [Nonomuraea pusilla]|uniref:Uncharacterized protein n=1 Tax=Nonomuraea pusilla TaxID=46177 RepID=A0A1H7QBG9_9ACTN|nr:hypothetical protein [Nonomuraea pusilla]SEL44825.1 hypothetical protein SAMN05660976_02475 [Nonomuraea pusilla]
MGLAIAGMFGFLMVNLVVALVAISMESTVALGVAAGFLALLGLGAGVVLVVLRKSWSIGLGLGLMIGWGLSSIVTAGFCTGLNPALYT